MRIEDISIGLIAKGLMSITCVAIASAPIAVSALPRQEVTRIYYQDASKEEIVGQSISSCQGGRSMQGRVTRYVDVESEPCESASPQPDLPRSEIPCEFRADFTCLYLP